MGMNIKFDTCFLNDLKKLKNKDIAQRLKYIINTIEKAESIHTIRNLKKMEGYTSYYRIRIGNYRIGLELVNDDTIIFVRLKHSKDIYKVFP